MANTGYKSISRIDQKHKHHHGWYVRVTWNKETYSKFFSDKYYGSKALALEEAVKYRNQLEEQLGKPRSEHLVIGQVRPSNTGVRGIRRITTTQNKKGREYSWDVYQVTYHPAPGLTKRTSVSIQRYGEEEAFHRACKIREAKEKQRLKATRKKKRQFKKVQGIVKKYLKTKPVCRVTFYLSAKHAQQAKTVHIAGEFNDWQQTKTPLKRSKKGDFTVTVPLATERTYQYRYLLNESEWINDPLAELLVDNGFGGQNSAIYV